jgi:hypothetical protein
MTTLLLRASRLAGLAAMVAASCATWAATGSLVRARCTHVGVRPDVEGVDGVAVEVRLSTDWPACRVVYP